MDLGALFYTLTGLYSCPAVTICLPYALLHHISIKNGTRQGCPLFPLIFVLSIEPLAAAIRPNPDITGGRLQNREFKISLYADDVLLTLTNLHLTLPNLHAHLQAFGSLSGYKINMAKTEASPFISLLLYWLLSRTNLSITGRCLPISF